MKTQKFDSILTIWNIWDITNVAEKRYIMTQVIQEHGDHYTHDDFVSFLVKKYRRTQSSYSKVPGKKEQQEY